MDAPIGVGILGSGFMGRTWAETVRTNANARLVAIAGGTRAAALGADYDVPVVDLVALLGDPKVDLVLLATPPRSHPEQAIAAANAGKHLLIEKPMANTVADCDTITEAAVRNDIRLAIVSQHRFRQSPLAARKLIDDGRIGDVRMIRVMGATAGYDAPNDTWKADPNEQTVWADWAAHACDVTRWMAGSEPTLAFAAAQSFQPEPPPEQSAMAVYHFGNGVMADIWLTYEISPPGLGSALQFFITGSKGMIDFDSYGSVKLGDADGWRTVYEQPSFDPMDPLNPVRIKAYSDELDDVVGAIRERREPRVNATDSAPNHRDGGGSRAVDPLRRGRPLSVALINATRGSPMRPNKFRELLRAGRPTFGTHLFTQWPTIVEVVGHTGNFDYIEFSGEYAPYDLFSIENWVRATELYGMSSMIKLDQEPRVWLAERAIGAGFQSRALRRHPHGRRGAGRGQGRARRHARRRRHPRCRRPAGGAHAPRRPSRSTSTR